MQYKILSFILSQKNLYEKGFFAILQKFVKNPIKNALCLGDIAEHIFITLNTCHKLLQMRRITTHLSYLITADQAHFHPHHIRDQTPL